MAHTRHFGVHKIGEMMKSRFTKPMGSDEAYATDHGGLKKLSKSLEPFRNVANSSRLEIFIFVVSYRISSS